MGQATARRRNSTMVSAELFLFRDESEEPNVPNRELLELVTREGNKSLFVGRSFTTDAMDLLMSVSTIQLISTNQASRLVQIAVSARILTRNDGSRYKSVTLVPRKGTKSVDTLEFEIAKTATRWEEVTVPIVSLNR
jgi:hypothetical protein